MSDYLWDNEGDADADVAELERALAPLRHRAAPLPSLPSRAPITFAPRRRWLVAASVLAATAALVLVVLRPRRPRADGWIDTAASGVTLRVGSIGTVELDAGARARFVDEGRIELRHGRLFARIAAPPRRFAVITPHAVVTDLGCAFTVAVDDTGDAHVVVSEGRVAVGEIVVAAGGEADATAAGVTTPAPSVPPSAPSAPSPMAPSLSPPSPVKHGKHVKPTHAKPTRAIAPTRTPAKQSTAPAKKPERAPGLTHDPLKDLERSVE